MKQCPTCQRQKEYSAFYKNARTSDGFAYRCKACQSEYSRRYRAAKSESILQKKKQWYASNKESTLKYQADYYANNKERIVRRVVQYRQNRLKTDPTFKLQKNLRHRLSKLLKQQSSKIAISFLGCSLDELKKHLGFQFQPGMTWDNYGQWHIDHKVPLSSFDLTDLEQIKLACSYNNLQPLWAKDNRSKSDKVE